jgi:hypothetical protein
MVGGDGVVVATLMVRVIRVAFISCIMGGGGRRRWGWQVMGGGDGDLYRMYELYNGWWW